MKNTRKKMLLSSVAMLLVALVALGSATFAWYYVQNTVTAETQSWSASTAEGLVIRHATSGDWLTKLTDLKSKTELSPATINYAATKGNTFGATGQGKSFTDGTLDGSLTGKAIPTASDGNFLIDTFWVASNGSSNQNATFTVKGSANASTYLNLAIYVNGKLAAVMTSDSAAGAKVKGQAGNTQASPTSVTTGDDLQALTKLDGSVDIGVLTATPKGTNESGTKIDIIGFADGYNDKCTSKTANNTAVNVTYEFSTTSDTATLG